MAAISITASAVLGSALAERLTQYKAAAAITAGQAVYLNASNQWALIDTDASLGTGIGDIRGIAECSAPGVGQPVTVVVYDPNFTTGGTMVNGQTVYAFTTAGAITVADIPTTGQKPVILGVCNSTTSMVMPRYGVATGVVI